MFWFREKTLSGSYLSFSATRRSYFSGPNVARTRSSPVSALNVSGAPARANGSMNSPQRRTHASSYSDSASVSQMAIASTTQLPASGLIAMASAGTRPNAPPGGWQNGDVG